MDRLHRASARRAIWRAYAAAGFGEIVGIAWANPPNDAADLIAPYARLVDAMTDADLVRTQDDLESAAHGVERFYEPPPGPEVAQVESYEVQIGSRGLLPAEPERVPEVRTMSDAELIAAARQLYAPGQLMEADVVAAALALEPGAAQRLLGIMEGQGLLHAGVVLYVKESPPRPNPVQAAMALQDPPLGEGEGTIDDPLYQAALGLFSIGQFVSPTLMVQHLGITPRRARALRDCFEAEHQTTNGVR